MTLSNEVVELVVRVLAQRVAALEHDNECWKAECAPRRMVPVKERAKVPRKKKFDPKTAVPPWAQ